MKNGLIYGLEERPPLRDTLFAALQHLLAIFVAIITPPLIIAGALGLDVETTSFLVSMSLFVSGIATFVQCRRLGAVGCGLLCIQGTSFSFISPIIMAGTIGGLPAIFGATMVGAFAEVFISRILKYAMKIITPLVSGIVVTLIGISLIKVGITSCGGGNAAIEAYGDITANSLISGEPVDGEKFLKRAQGGILADGINSAIAGALNSFPNSIFAQNNGMIQLTGVASRYVGYFIALFLVLLGFFPIIGVIFSFMPDPVLGGATLLMFGTVASAGVKIIASQHIDRKATLVIAISFSMGLGVELYPDILMQFPETIKNIFSSGITTGGLAAIISNMIIRIKEE